MDSSPLDLFVPFRLLRERQIWCKRVHFQVKLRGRMLGRWRTLLSIPGRRLVGQLLRLSGCSFYFRVKGRGCRVWVRRLPGRDFAVPSCEEKNPTSLDQIKTQSRSVQSVRTTALRLHDSYALRLHDSYALRLDIHTIRTVSIALPVSYYVLRCPGRLLQLLASAAKPDLRVVGPLCLLPWCTAVLVS